MNSSFCEILLLLIDIVYNCNRNCNLVELIEIVVDYLKR